MHVQLTVTCHYSLILALSLIRSYVLTVSSYYYNVCCIHISHMYIVTYYVIDLDSIQVDTITAHRMFHTAISADEVHALTIQSCECSIYSLAQSELATMETESTG